MKTNTLLVGAGVLVTAAVTLLDRRATRREVDDLRATLKQVEVARSHATASNAPPSWPSFALQAQQAAASPTAPTEGASNAPQPIDAAGAPADRRARAERSRSRAGRSRTESFAPIHDTMEAAFVSENADPSWARDARRTAERSLIQHMPDGSRIASIECRSTMCRIESNHDHAHAADAFANETLGSSERQPWNGAFATGAISEGDNGGSVTMVSYLMREGNEMPSVDNETL